jgi:hypothetical protein
MQLEMSVLELVDLQSALRRARHYNEDMIERLGDAAPTTCKGLEADTKRYEELIQWREDCFNERYPPATEELEATA